MASDLLVFIGTMRNQGNRGIGDIFLSGKLRVELKSAREIPLTQTINLPFLKKAEEERARDTHLTTLPPFFLGLELFGFEPFQKQSALIPYFEQPQPPEDVPSDLSEQHPVFFP